MLSYLIYVSMREKMYLPRPRKRCPDMPADSPNTAACRMSVSDTDLLLPEQGVHRRLVHRQLFRLFDPLRVFLMMGKGRRQKAPKLLHLKQDGPGSRHHFLIVPVELIVEPAQGFLVQSDALPDLPAQPRIHQKPSSKHPPVHLRKCLLCLPVRLCTKQIPVVADRVSAVFAGFSEYLPVGVIPIHILLDPGMDDQLLHRILVINLQEPPKFLRAVLPDPGLDGNFRVRLFEHPVQEPVQLLGKCQEAGAPLFGRHGPGRTCGPYARNPPQNLSGSGGWRTCPDCSGAARPAAPGSLNVRAGSA